MKHLKTFIYSLLSHLYSNIFIIFIPIIFLKKFNYRKRWLERFGQTKIRLKDSIWLHSVSVGEAFSAEPLVKKLLVNYPDDNFVITTTTLTGSDVVKRLYSNYKNVYHLYIPYDILPFINSFFTKINPKIFIIIETEIWPNILNKCFNTDIPVVVTNARLSKRSMRNYTKLPFAKEFLFSKISHVNAQTEKDAKRYYSLGIPKERISLTGNIKYNLITPANLQEKMSKLKKSLEGRPIWIAGSTHQGEEEDILKAHRNILKIFPECLLIIVPRHKERFLKTEKLINNKCFLIQKRSLFRNEIFSNTQVYLGDTMGELLDLYYISDIAFVGGSLIDHGGHNLLEPAALAKPIISGRSLFNFSNISKELTENKALVKVSDYNELTKIILKIFSNKSLSNKMSIASLKTFREHSDVLEKQYNNIIKFL